MQVLLAELSLYFLIFTEAANLRHCPEALWFLFWCSSHSPAFAAFASRPVELATPQKVPVGYSLRDWRIQCRNLFQVYVSRCCESLRESK